MQQVAANCVPRNFSNTCCSPFACESCLPGCARQILAAIVGAHRDSFFCVPDEFLFVIGALQVGANSGFPFGRRVRREFLPHYVNPPAQPRSDNQALPLPSFWDAQKIPWFRATRAAVPDR